MINHNFGELQAIKEETNSKDLLYKWGMSKMESSWCDAIESLVNNQQVDDSMETS